MTGILTKDQITVVNALVNLYHLGNFGPYKPMTAKDRRWLRDNLHLLDGIECSDDRIAILWSVEDVLSVRPDLSKKKARAVLKAVERGHDCEYGVTWDTIKDTADAMFPRKVRVRKAAAI